MDGSSSAMPAGEPRNTIFVLKLDAAGEMVSENEIDAASVLGDVDIRSIAAARDGGFVVTGEIAETDAFKNLLLAQFDPDANLMWKRSVGGPKLESGREVVATVDDGCWAVGVSDAFDDKQPLFVVRADKSGEDRCREDVGGAKGRYEIGGIRATADGGLLVAGEYRRFRRRPSGVAGIAERMLTAMCSGNSGFNNPMSDTPVSQPWKRPKAESWCWQREAGATRTSTLSPCCNSSYLP